ncbi:hypothetical protein Ancab_016547 [Ancistrocladus abbreviatus]
MVAASFICGSNSLPREDNDLESHSANSTPRRSSSSKKDDKNPYSSRGLDKFCTLLAEIEEKKQKIYSQLGEDEISLVRFVYSNDNRVKPIVVKAKGNKERLSKSLNNSGPLDNPPAPAPAPAPAPSPAAADAVVKPSSSQAVENKKKPWFNKWRLNGMKQPCYYWPAIVVLILLFLAFFGRSVAILCTSIGWYLVPTITNGDSNLKRPTKKKDYTRKLSDKKMLDHGVSSTDPKSPLAIRHRKSHSK